MALVVLSETEYGKELAKWNVRKPYQPFPKMVFKATRNDQGYVERCIALDLEVGNEEELAKAKANGYTESPGDAVKAFTKWDDLMAEEAARRNYTDQRMSTKAQAEVARAEAASGLDMLPSMPETPIVKRRAKGWPKGKPRKVEPIQES